MQKISLRPAPQLQPQGHVWSIARKVVPPSGVIAWSQTEAASRHPKYLIIEYLGPNPRSMVAAPWVPNNHIHGPSGNHLKSQYTLVCLTSPQDLGKPAPTWGPTVASRPHGREAGTHRRRCSLQGAVFYSLGLVFKEDAVSSWPEPYQ